MIILIGLISVSININAGPLDSGGLVTALIPTKKEFVEGEPIFVRLLIENKGTNAVEVNLGRCLVANIWMWTDAEPAKKQSRRLREGGIQPGNRPFALNHGETYETLLLVNEWFGLTSGKHKLYGELKSSHSESTNVAVISIVEAKSDGLQQALKRILIEAAQDHGNKVLYVRGVMEACKKSDGKKALLALQDNLGDPQCIDMIKYALKYYDAVWGD